jgi:glycosyltransferase involved in cell wall biosynthesis
LDVLARALARAGHDVLLVASGDSTCPVPRAWALDEAAGTESTSSATELRHVIGAYDAVREWGPDLVHDHTLVGPVYSARFGLPIVTTNHGPFVGELEPLYRAIGAAVPIIALSHHHASTAAPTPVAAVIHHGLDVDEIPFGTGRGGYAAFLGRMSPHKGAHVAVRAARRAGIPLKIAAKMREPAECAYFEHEVEPHLGGDVEFLGEVGGAAKHELLADATCLLNPLAWPEPFGLVMIEAMACGTPVVATPCGSVPELVTDGATGFLASSVEGLADALRRVATLDRTRCRTEAEVRFSADRMCDDHLALYEQVVARQERDARSSARRGRRDDIGPAEGNGGPERDSGPGRDATPPAEASAELGSEVVAPGPRVGSPR